MNLSVIARIYQLRHVLRISVLSGLLATLPIHTRALKPLIRKSH